MANQRRGIALGVAAVASLVAVTACGACVGVPCLSTGIWYGAWEDRCPDGRMRLGLQVSGSLIRGERGELDIAPLLRFVDGDGRLHVARAWRMVPQTIELRASDGSVVPDVEVTSTWTGYALKLPKALPDGEYVAHVTATLGDETQTLDVSVPLFAPALAHVLTDQPIYTPGSTVRMRTLMLRRPDHTPLDGRPGRWTILDPAGQQMLVEKDQAGSFGVAESEFELAPDALVGAWTASWSSGEATDSATFTVSPFRLPRLTVEPKASQAWYRVGEAVVIEGKASYASGAPVREAPVTVQLRPADGEWPMPIAWERPFEVKTDAWGRFRVEVGAVPPDLVGRAAIDAAVEVTDDAGETVSGHAAIVVSQHELRVDAVTEFGGGLVGGFNNRVFVRVTSPDGVPLASRTIHVTRAWRTGDAGYDAVTDVDGVASVQVDPGDPVTVVLPQQPVRVRPLAVTPTVLVEATGYGSDGDLGLDDRRAVDAVLPAVRRCADRVIGDQDARVWVRVLPDGRVSGAGAAVDDALHRCVIAAVGGLRAPPAGLRTWSLGWRVGDPGTPRVVANATAVIGDTSEGDARIADAARSARGCLPRDMPFGGAVADVHWHVARGERVIDAVVADVDGAAVSSEVRRCVVAAVRSLAPLSAPATEERVGVARIDVVLPDGVPSGAPGPATMTGYELRIAAPGGEATASETPLVLPPGEVPPLRLRAEPTIVAPGGAVTIDVLRGPGFHGDLPVELALRDGSGQVGKPVKVVDKKVTFPIPGDADGLLNVEWGGARALILVRRTDPLAVTLRSDKPAYRPGETATLTVTTTAGGAPVAAGVGLVGVDETLGQLAPLPGPDAYGRVTVAATSATRAFGTFDAKALLLGQIRGDNAADATLLGVGAIPSEPFGDAWTYASGVTTDDDASPLAASFWRGVAALQAKVTAWEAGAKPGEVLTNPMVVAWWAEVLREERSAGRPVVDAFDRELTLARLSDDLVARLDPRGLVDDATHLPEDVVDWRTWLAEEVR